MRGYENFYQIAIFYIYLFFKIDVIGSIILALEINTIPIISRNPNVSPANKATEIDPTTISVINSSPTNPGFKNFGPQSVAKVPGKINSITKINKIGKAGDTCEAVGKNFGARAIAISIENTVAQKKKPSVISIVDAF